MGNLDFKKYLSLFESTIARAVQENKIGKVSQVSTRPGRFSYSQFARRMGKEVVDRTPFILDYYGYPKRSSGFSALLGEEQEQMPGRQIKSVKTTVVYFASLSIEDLMLITESNYLRARFPDFKSTILGWRGFYNNGTKEENKLAKNTDA